MSEQKNLRNALVLTGGAIKGVFQAGAIAEVLKSFTPDAIYGISVGSLNGAFLADRAGRAALAGRQPDWPAIGEELAEFWKANIHGFQSIARKRGIFGLALGLLFKRFRGLTSTQPIRDLVHRTFDEAHLRASPVHFAAGSVNLADGALIYADCNYDRFLDYILASSAIPLMMPVVSINRQPLVDGGIRDSAPLKPAIDRGARKIVTVSCHAPDISVPAFDPRDLGALSSRVMEVIMDEQIDNDLRTAQLINALIQADPSSPLARGKHPLDLHIVQPVVPPDLDMMHFTHADVVRMLEVGRQAGRRARLEDRLDVA